MKTNRQNTPTKVGEVGLGGSAETDDLAISQRETTRYNDIINNIEPMLISEDSFDAESI